MNIIWHFFPELKGLLENIKDCRDQRYTTYDTEILLLERIIATVFHIRSMRSMSTEFNCDGYIRNMYYILGVKPNEDLPHWSTINNFLKKLDSTQIEQIIPKLVNHIIRMKTFDDS